MARMNPREIQNVEYKRSWQEEYLVSPIHYEGLRRKEALREIVCNAIVHKNTQGRLFR